MHGLVHKALEKYVVERAGETSWETVREEANLEPTLYLSVTHYPDEEAEAVLETLATLSGHDRRHLERDVGRFLAPDLLRTFDAHIRDGWSAIDLLAAIDPVAAKLGGGEDGDGENPLALAGERDGDAAIVTHPGDYCALVRGLLEGILAEFGTGGEIEERECVRDGDERCAFRIEAASD